MTQVIRERKKYMKPLRKLLARARDEVVAVDTGDGDDWTCLYTKKGVRCYLEGNELWVVEDIFVEATEFDDEVH